MREILDSVKSAVKVIYPNVAKSGHQYVKMAGLLDQMWACSGWWLAEMVRRITNIVRIKQDLNKNECHFTWLVFHTQPSMFSSNQTWRVTGEHISLPGISVGLHIAFSPQHSHYTTCTDLIISVQTHLGTILSFQGMNQDVHQYDGYTVIEPKPLC